MVNKNVARGAATRDQLLAIATRLFAEHGYEDTSTGMVLTQAKVSRGSLYHHFPSKDVLFQAVVEALEADVSRRTGEATTGITDPVEGLRAGAQAWLRIAGEPIVQRVLLTDAPSVLGWQRWREMEEHYALGGLKVALGVIAASGALQPDLVDTFAHVLLASLNEIALMIARADDVPAATAQGTAAADELIDRLLSPAG